jgi:orotate phosphoribosyltransferase
LGRKFKLSTGDVSSFYFDCKRAMLDGPTLAMIADALLDKIQELPEVPTAIAGLTLGADPLIAAVIMRSAQTGGPIRAGSIVRKARKEHGTESMIENELRPGTPVVVVDDVITQGKSIQVACDELANAGYRIVGIIALIDREAGGLQRLQKANECPVLPLFQKRDFPRLLAEEARHAREHTATAAHS